MLAFVLAWLGSVHFKSSADSAVEIDVEIPGAAHAGGSCTTQWCLDMRKKCDAACDREHDPIKDARDNRRCSARCSTFQTRCGTCCNKCEREKNCDSTMCWGG